MSNKILSIEQAKHVSPSEQFKDWLGRLAVLLNPTLALRLYRTPRTETQGLAEKAIMFHLRRRALLENRTKFLERIHRTFWAGKMGGLYSSNCDHRFNDLFLAQQRPDFQELRTAWDKWEPHTDSNNAKSIVEIGCNSGLLLNYLTHNLSDVSHALGIDINDQQIRSNQQAKQFDPRVDFLCGDGPKWVMENGKPNTLFVTNGGVLEYFPRPKLDEMLTHISATCRPAIFFASEPVAKDHDMDNQLESVPFGEEFSFSHNYRDLFQSNGFQVVHQRAINYQSWRMMATIAVTSN